MTTYTATLLPSASNPVVEERIRLVPSDRFSPAQAQSGMFTMHRGVRTDVTSSGEGVFRVLRSAGGLLITGITNALPLGGAELVDAAERRFDQLQADVGQGQFFDDDGFQAPVSVTAVKRARALIRTFASGLLLPARHISIFATPDGGLQLQSTGATSAVSVEVPPEPFDPILAEFASDDEYHSMVFDDIRAAADFLSRAIQ